MCEKRKILQMFGWSWNEIANHAQEIYYAGWNYVQTSPVTPTKDESNNEFWLLYQPIAFTCGNRLGTNEEFIHMCEVLHSYGIKVIVDGVFRHMAGDDQGRLIPHYKCDKGIASRRDFWLQPINSSNDYDRWQQTNRCFGMPSLNYYNIELLDSVFLPFMDYLLTYADGIRFDMAKHFSLPYEYGAQFWRIIHDRYPDKYLYGECLDIDQKTFNNYIPYLDVLTNFRPYENEDNAVVFCESHDTYYTFKSTCHMSNHERMQEYRLLLHRYNNVLYFARPYDRTIFSDDIRFINIHC